FLTRRSVASQRSGRYRPVQQVRRCPRHRTGRTGLDLEPTTSPSCDVRSAPTCGARRAGYPPRARPGVSSGRSTATSAQEGTELGKHITRLATVLAALILTLAGSVAMASSANADVPGTAYRSIKNNAWGQCASTASTAAGSHIFLGACDSASGANWVKVPTG